MSKNIEGTAYVSNMAGLQSKSVIYTAMTSKRYINVFITVILLVIAAVLLSYIIRPKRLRTAKLLQKQQTASKLQQKRTPQEVKKDMVVNYFFDDNDDGVEDYPDEEYEENELNDLNVYDDTDYREEDSDYGNFPFLNWFNDDYENLDDMSHSQLEDALDKIIQLENKIQGMEIHMNKEYPVVATLAPGEIKRILVTGGAGFVGSHLVDRLMKQGHKVLVVDDYSTGRQQNIIHWMGHPNLEVVHQDITQNLLMDVDQVYHLAAPDSSNRIDPIKVFQTHTIGTMNVLGLAKRVGARVLIGSSSEVYGNPTVEPVAENYTVRIDPTAKITTFEEGNRAKEALAYAYSRQEKVVVRVARIFNTYGPRMRGDGPIGILLRQALKKKTLSADGLPNKSFLYVSDLVDGLVTLMNSDYSNPINFGNTEHISVQRVAELLTKIVQEEGVGENVDIRRTGLKLTSRKFSVLKTAVDSHLWPDITAAQTHLNWTIKIPLEEGLKKTWDFLTHPDLTISLKEFQELVENEETPQNPVVTELRAGSQTENGNPNDTPIGIESPATTQVENKIAVPLEVQSDLSAAREEITEQLAQTEIVANSQVEIGLPVNSGLPVEIGLPVESGIPVEMGLPVEFGHPVESGLQGDTGLPAKMEGSTGLSTEPLVKKGSRVRTRNGLSSGKTDVNRKVMSAGIPISSRKRKTGLPLSTQVKNGGSVRTPASNQLQSAIMSRTVEFKNGKANP